MKRSLAREQAFMLVFERAFKDESLDEIIEGATDGRSVEVDAFSYQLADQVLGHLPQIDDIIGKYSTKWKIGRLPKVTLSVLRLSLGELDYMEDIPISVTINEAVELAKRYATEDDASYVNGVLGAYVRDKSLPQE